MALFINCGDVTPEALVSELCAQRQSEEKARTGQARDVISDDCHTSIRAANVLIWKPPMLKEFKAFIAKGNVLDLAVAVIV